MNTKPRNKDCYHEIPETQEKWIQQGTLTSYGSEYPNFNREIPEINESSNKQETRITIDSGYAKSTTK
jgi:hypothetical protein